MASKLSSPSVALFLALNLVFFALASAWTPPAPTKETCPIDVLKLAVCADVLQKLIHIGLGKPSSAPCCPLIHGLVDLDAAVCVCTAIKSNLLGIVLDIPLAVSLLVNFCGKDVPKDFQCP